MPPTLATMRFAAAVSESETTADAVAELLATGRVPDLIVPFAPGRFAGGVPAPAGTERSAP